MCMGLMSLLFIGQEQHMNNLYLNSVAAAAYPSIFQYYTELIVTPMTFYQA